MSTLNKNYNEMTGEELRALAIDADDTARSELLGKMDEEDYTAVIDFELSLQNPDSRIMAFCYQGLCKYEAYGKETDKLDISELIKRSGISRKIGRNNQTAEEIKTFSVLDFKKRNLTRENFSDKNTRILKNTLKERLHDTYEKEGITFIITNAKGAYNLSWLNKDVLYNIDSKLSLSDVNDFISSYAA